MQDAIDALLSHARALVGVSLAELADGLGLPVPVGRVKTKGWAGQIIERELGASEHERRGPDFSALGIELKTVPLDERGVPLESTAVCQIDPITIAGESWQTSYVRQKLAHVLFVGLSVPAETSSVGDRTVETVKLWSPAPDEDRLLCSDFELFVHRYFRLGRASDITGHEGTALQVRPKGRNARDTRAAYGPDGIPTQIGKCGFYLRPAFVARVLVGP